jgi:hypothetical protein
MRGSLNKLYPLESFALDSLLPIGEYNFYVCPCSCLSNYYIKDLFATKEHNYFIF